MGPGGFEPPTNALKGHCSTVELKTQVPQTRFELVRLAPTDFKSVVYTVPPPGETNILLSYIDIEKSIHFLRNLSISIVKLLLLFEDIIRTHVDIFHNLEVSGSQFAIDDSIIVGFNKYTTSNRL